MATTIQSSDEVESEAGSSADSVDMMEIGDFKETEAFNANYKSIKELGLEPNILEPDVYGFTVIPPEKVAPPEFLERIRNTVPRK